MDGIVSNKENLSNIVCEWIKCCDK